MATAARPLSLSYICVQGRSARLDVRPEPPPAVETRLGRRTALTFPLAPPPQNNLSPPSELEPRDARSGRHLEPLQYPSRLRIDPPQFALVAFPGSVPELAVDPGDPGDEAVGHDRAKNRPGLRIDLMDLPLPVASHPERPFGPRKPRIGAAAGRRYRGEHAAGPRVDLLDAILGELIKALSIEGCPCMRGDVDPVENLPACRIEGVQPVSGRKPDALTVIGHPVHVVGARKGSVLAQDFSGGSVHASILDIAHHRERQPRVHRCWVRCVQASSQTFSLSSSKMSLGSASAVPQAPCSISSSSCPAPQPA